MGLVRPEEQIWLNYISTGRTGMKKRTRRRKIEDLRSHPEPWVTVAELAEYWLVSPKQVYKQIEAGTLHAIRLGPRLLRIRTTDALAFERLAKMGPKETLEKG